MVVLCSLNAKLVPNFTISLNKFWLSKRDARLIDYNPEMVVMALSNVKFEGHSQTVVVLPSTSVVRGNLVFCHHF